MSWGAAIGGIASGIAGAVSADKAAKRQIAWERERATHAHQWEVQDLKAAGLNPILSAGGSGAVTGGISAPVPDFSGIAGIAGDIAQTEQATTAKKAQKSQEKLQTAEVKQAEANSALAEIQKEAAKAEFEAKKPQLEAEKKYNQSKFGKGAHTARQAWNDISPIATGIGTAIAFGTGGKLVKKAITAGGAANILRTPRPNLMYEPGGVIYATPHGFRNAR